jgi:membrane protease YdiL (CAAX protease family)
LITIRALASSPSNFFNRTSFLTLAIVLEGGLAVVALILGRLTGTDPLNHFTFNWPALTWAVVGTTPLVLFFMLSYRFPVGPLWPIKEFLVKTLGPYLNTCYWYDLLLIALLAGVCEELFFRGFLQPWIESIGGGTVSLLGSNLVFALVHFITPAYALLAGLMGVYLGLLLDASGQRNLFIPILAHTIYDFLAFVVVARTFRLEQAN